MAHVRLYQPSDEEAVVHIFRETAHVDLRTHPDPSILRIGEFLWCRPYIHYHPEWSYVLDDGTGKAVGYILCAPDSVPFVQRWKAEYTAVLVRNGIKEPTVSEDVNDRAVQLRYDVFNPETQLQPDYPDLVRQHPAHLHIDILNSHQGQGWGQVLMATLFQRLLLEGVSGIFLGMAADNDGAGRFYKRLGFERYSAMNQKGEVGRNGDAIYWVRTFQRDQPA